MSSGQGARAYARRRSASPPGRHFNCGQRAFFLALGYLGWFINAYALAVATLVVVLVLLNRQFGNRGAPGAAGVAR